MFITKTVVAASDVPARHGRDAGAAVLDAMVPALTAHGADRGGADAPLRRGLRADGRAARATGRRRRPAPASSSAPILKPLETFRDSLTVVSNLDRPLQGTHAVSTGTWLTGMRAEADRGRGRRRRHVARSDHRRADRPGHGVPVARARHRGSDRLRRRLRRRLQLRLHEHASRGSRRRRRCRWRSIRAWCSSGCSAGRARPAERLRADAAEPQHPRLGAAATSPRSSAGSARATASGSTSISSTSARSSGGFSAPRSRRRPRSTVPDAPVGMPDVVRRARRRDVRPAGAGVPGRPHARLHVHAGPRGQPAGVPEARRQRAVAPRVASRQRAGEARAARQDEHLADQPVRQVPRAAASRRPTATARCSITR